jgi:competence protein ComEA
VVTVPGGSRVADALAAAGGLRTDADPDRLNLAAVLRDGERVAVPVAGQPAPVLAEGGGGSAGGPGGTGGGSGDDKVVGTVDLNTATEAELEGLPGVGPSTAAAIVEHRTSSGPFRSVEDLLDVRGIGDAKLEQLRARVTVG